MMRYALSDFPPARFSITASFVDVQVPSIDFRSPGLAAPENGISPFEVITQGQGSPSSTPSACCRLKIASTDEDSGTRSGRALLERLRVVTTARGRNRFPTTASARLRSAVARSESGRARYRRRHGNRARHIPRK